MCVSRCPRSKPLRKAMCYRQAFVVAFGYVLSLPAVQLVFSPWIHRRVSSGSLLVRYRLGVGVFGCGKGSSTEVSQIATRGHPNSAIDNAR